MIIKNGNVFQEDGSYKVTDLYIENGRIAASEDEVTDKTQLDAAGLKVLPGLVDIHSHGAVRHDFSDADVDGLKIILQYEKSQGITSYCPTSMTLPKEELLKIFQTAKDVEQDETCARIVVIRIRAQVCKALPDSRILHAGNPEPLHRFCATGHLVDETENQFSLPACIGRGGHTVHIRAVEQRAHNFKLLFLFVRDNELPRLGQDGQIFILPLAVFFIVLARFRKGHQMPDAPADQIPAALPVAVLLFSGPDHGGDAAGYTGLFGNYQLNAHVSSSCPSSE